MGVNNSEMQPNVWWWDEENIRQRRKMELRNHNWAIPGNWGTKGVSEIVSGVITIRKQFQIYWTRVLYKFPLVYNQKDDEKAKAKYAHRITKNDENFTGEEEKRMEGKEKGNLTIEWGWRYFRGGCCFEATFWAAPVMA